MGILDWLRRPDRKSLASPSSSLLGVFGVVPTAAGITVTPDVALRCTPVNAAVRVLSESVAALPLHLFRRAGEARERARDHRAYHLLHDAPNEWTGSYEFRLQGQVDVLLHGNAFGYVNRIGGEVREITRLPPENVTVTAGPAGEPRYRVATGAGARDCGPNEIIHVKALSIDGLRGIAPIHHAREAIALSLALENHSANILGSGGRPSGILRIKGTDQHRLTEEQMSRIRSQWAQSHAGGDSGKTAVFDQHIEFEPLTFKSVDMEFVAQRRFQLEEISRAFRVPPHLLSELGRATWSNAAEMGQAFLDYTLQPWLLAWQSALTRAVLLPAERADHFIEFDTSALVRANLTARFAAYSTAVGGPWMAPNEARGLENRPPLEGGEVLNKPQGAAPANENPQPEKQPA